MINAEPYLAWDEEDPIYNDFSLMPIKHYETLTSFRVLQGIHQNVKKGRYTFKQLDKIHLLLYQLTNLAYLKDDVIAIKRLATVRNDICSEMFACAEEICSEMFAYVEENSSKLQPIKVKIVK